MALKTWIRTIQENWFTAKPIVEYGNYSKNGFTGFFYIF